MVMSSKLIGIVIALAVFGLGIAAHTCWGQTDSAAGRSTPDHSCTVHGGYSFVMPAGTDGSNFKNGVGFEAGGGFGWTAWTEQPHQPNLFLMFDYGYSHAE